MVSMDEPRALLAEVPIFSDLSARSLKKLADLCVSQSFDTGEALIEQGDTGLGLFLLVDGEVEVFYDEGERRESLAVLDSGQVVGEMSLIDDRPRSASVVARRPTRTLLLSRTGFRKLVQKEPEVAWCFVPVLVERLREAQNHAFAAEVALDRATRGTPEVAASPEAPEATAAEAPRPATASEATASEATASEATASETAALETTASEPMPDVWSDPSAGDEASADPENLDASRIGNGRRPPASRVRSLLDTQHAISRAGLALAEESVGLFEQLLDTLVDEVGLDSERSTAAVLRAMPAGTAKAWVAACREAGKSPRRVYEAFRHPRRRTADGTDR